METVNLNKLKQDLMDAFKKRAVRVATTKSLDKEGNGPRNIFFKAVGTNEIKKVLDDVFANVDIEQIRAETGEDIDLSDVYARELRTIADSLEAARCKIWRGMRENDDHKEDLNNKLFALQSDIRSAADLVSWSYFGQ